MGNPQEEGGGASEGGPLVGSGEVLPRWLRFGLGVDDLKDAYRTVPVLPEHRGFNVAAFYDLRDGEWQFPVQRGHALGWWLPSLTSAVSGRVPQQLKKGFAPRRWRHSSSARIRWTLILSGARPRRARVQ